MIRAYHFIGATLRDGSPVPPDGEWLEYTGKCVMCESGLHASRHPFDALQYAPGNILCLVECDGIADEQLDKIVCSRRRIVAHFNATDLLRSFARQCASDVLHLLDGPLSSTQVVRDFLATGDKSLRDAARVAAEAAARDAAWVAAWAAAEAAARVAARVAAEAAAEAAARAAAWAAAEAAAWVAAEAAAWVAAWAAAEAAARDATRDAARDAQKTKFHSLVDAEFAKLGVQQ